ncbi:MAG: glycosyltransferase family 4 protein [Methanotrichaceae archaeon]|nr:glycosyltransferase family 4 protein [Methanotrichaceae archaeon]
MNVLVLDSHSIEDSRIGRHLRYLIGNSFDVYRVNYNFYDSVSREWDCSSRYGEACSGLDLFYIFNKNKGIKRRILNTSYLMGKAIVSKTEKTINELGLNLFKPTIVHVHDPILLPVASNLVKRHYGWKLVYDRHELYESSHKDCGINVARALEQLSIRQISAVVIVSNEHLSKTRQLFPKAIIVPVPNYPSIYDYNEKTIMDKINSLNQYTDIVISYIGSLDKNFDRDIDLMIRIGQEAVESFGSRFLLGGRILDAKLETKVREFSSKYSGKFCFLGYVQREETIELTTRSHLGLYLMKPDSCYWVKCSPNKVFEYLICGTVPIIRADIERKDEMAKCALLFDRSTSNDEVLEYILKLIADRQRLKKMMMNAKDISANFTFESVAKGYKELYESVLNNSPY